MRSPVAIAISLLLITACSEHVAAPPYIEEKYADGMLEEVVKQLGTLDDIELAVSFPVSVNANIRVFLSSGDASALGRAKAVNEDYYAMGAGGVVGSRDALAYAELISELESGSAAEFGYICANVHGFNSDAVSAECSCRSFLVNDALTNIGAASKYPHVERALWIAESSRSVCESYGLDWPSVTSLLRSELYPEFRSAFEGEQLRKEVAEGGVAASSWICALRGRYLDYASSDLARLEKSGVIVCPARQ